MTSYIYQIIGDGKQYVDFMIWVVFISIYIVLEKKDCWKFEDDYTYFISPDTFMLIGLRENMYAVNKIKKLVYREIRYGGRILDTVAYEVVFEYEGKVVKLQSFFDGNWYESDMARFYKFLNDVIAENDR